jgi:hypothetical protein
MIRRAADSDDSFRVTNLVRTDSEAAEASESWSDSESDSGGLGSLEVQVTITVVSACHGTVTRTLARASESPTLTSESPSLHGTVTDKPGPGPACQ